MIFTDYWKVILNFPKMEIWSFLSQKVDGKMVSTDYWKVLVLNFSEMEIRSFLSQKVDGKMIFTCFFWAIHDILGLGKYGFSCSGSQRYHGEIFQTCQRDLTWQLVWRLMWLCDWWLHVISYHLVKFGVHKTFGIGDKTLRR